MKTIEEQAKEFSKFDSATDIGTDLGTYRQGLFEGFIAGYQAAKDRQEYLINEMSILRSRLDTAEKLSQLVDEEKEQ